MDMNRQTLWAVILLCLFGVIGLSGCDTDDGPMESAGEQMDETMNRAGNAVEDACEDAKKATGMEDSDC
jgi:hypothetical protein